MTTKSSTLATRRRSLGVVVDAQAPEDPRDPPCPVMSGNAPTTDMSVSSPPVSCGGITTPAVKEHHHASPQPEELMSIAAHVAEHNASAAAGTDLEILRARLDGIDELMLDCVRDRIHCCLEIGEVKRRGDIAMMQPHRIAVVQQRAARYAERNGIDGEFLRRLYDLIIAETCRVETLVIASSAHQL